MRLSCKAFVVSRCCASMCNLEKPDHMFCGSACFIKRAQSRKNNVCCGRPFSILQYLRNYILYIKCLKHRANKRPQNAKGLSEPPCGLAMLHDVVVAGGVLSTGTTCSLWCLYSLLHELKIFLDRSTHPPNSRALFVHLSRSPSEFWPRLVHPIASSKQ